MERVVEAFRSGAGTASGLKDRGELNTICGCGWVGDVPRSCEEVSGVGHGESGGAGARLGLNDLVAAKLKEGETGGGKTGGEYRAGGLSGPCWSLW